MANPVSLAVLSGSLLAAVATGIHLGESAVAMIDPIHFQGPALHPRDRGAAIDERVLHSTGPAPVPRYGWEEGYAARATACDDCDARVAHEARIYSAVVPYFGDRERPARAKDHAGEAAEVRVVRGSGDTEYAEPIPNRQIERYASYPLGYEEAAFGAPLAEEQPVEDEEAYHH